MHGITCSFSPLTAEKYENQIYYNINYKKNPKTIKVCIQVCLQQKPMHI